MSDGGIVIQFPDRSHRASDAQPPIPFTGPRFSWDEWWDREVRAVLQRMSPRVKPRHRPFTAALMAARLEMMCDLHDAVTEIRP